MFEKLFVTGEADVVAELYARNKEKATAAEELRGLEQQFAELTGTAPVGIAFEKMCIRDRKWTLRYWKVNSPC